MWSLKKYSQDQFTPKFSLQNRSVQKLWSVKAENVLYIYFIQGKLLCEAVNKFYHGSVSGEDTYSNYNTYSVYSSAEVEGDWL